jgi:hypothetical protein
MSENKRFLVITTGELDEFAVEVGLYDDKQKEYYPLIFSEAITLPEQLFVPGVLRYITALNSTAYVCIGENNSRSQDVDALIKQLGGRSVTDSEWE